MTDRRGVVDSGGALDPSTDVWRTSLDGHRQPDPLSWASVPCTLPLDKCSVRIIHFCTIWVWEFLEYLACSFTCSKMIMSRRLLEPAKHGFLLFGWIAAEDTHRSTKNTTSLSPLVHLCSSMWLGIYIRNAQMRYLPASKFQVIETTLASSIDNYIH